MIGEQLQGNALRLAKVVAVHPEGHAVDLVFLDDGGRAANVQCISPYASTNTGAVDLPQPTPPTGNPWSPRLTGDRDILAVVAMLQQISVVIGFLYPQVCQMLFDPERWPDFRVERHASDVYRTVDQQANMELYHPSETWLRIGIEPDHVDLTGQDFDGKWQIRKNLGQQVHVKLSVNGGTTVFHIEPDGNVSLDTDGEITLRGSMINLN